MTESGDFVIVDGGAEPITDIKVLSKKENKSHDFEVVSTKWIGLRNVRDVGVSA